MNMTGREDTRVLGNNSKDGAGGRRGRLAVATAAIVAGKTRHTHVALEQREGPGATSRTTFPRVRRDRIFPEIVARMSTELEVEESKRVRRQRMTTKKPLKIETTTAAGTSDNARSLTPRTEASSTPSTPSGVRGSSDLRSPGVKKTPRSALADNDNEVLPDFITQTDKYGNATSPRSVTALQQAQDEYVDESGNLVLCQPSKSQDVVDVCAETLLDSLRIMCCCLMPEEGEAAHKANGSGGGTRQIAADAPRHIRSRPALLPKIHPDDCGKKCLVLDLDETLVHSSFRAVAGADFVIPVQIEDVVHFVYVAKRPGVDEFLTEMAKYYELVIYTASLNKYADPLLDLLDTNRVIRTRLFRESCVYHEGNYVKDLSKLDRDLSQTIIIDNSPNSYAFHPENAIDCSSFIDDPRDRELDHIGAFLAGLKDVRDVRGLCHQWREWPNVKLNSQ